MSFIIHVRRKERESISYQKPFRFDQGNNIFRYKLILVYRFGITAIYIYINFFFFWKILKTLQVLKR